MRSRKPSAPVRPSKVSGNSKSRSKIVPTSSGSRNCWTCDWWNTVASVPDHSMPDLCDSSLSDDGAQIEPQRPQNRHPPCGATAVLNTTSSLPAGIPAGRLFKDELLLLGNSPCRCRNRRETGKIPGLTTRLRHRCNRGFHRSRRNPGSSNRSLPHSLRSLSRPLLHCHPELHSHLRLRCRQFLVPIPQW